jgi:hypothetical protein
MNLIYLEHNAVNTQPPICLFQLLYLYDADPRIQNFEDLRETHMGMRVRGVVGET